MKSLFIAAAAAASFMFASCGSNETSNVHVSKYFHKYEVMTDSVSYETHIDSALVAIDGDEISIKEYAHGHMIEYHFVIFTKNVRNLVVASTDSYTSRHYDLSFFESGISLTLKESYISGVTYSK